ncbi:MAG: hypothetical protein WBV61_03405 [Rhodanobacteraceae bacterium]
MSASDVQSQLGALPEFAPDAALWPRVQAAHRRRRRQRAVRRVGFGAAIMVLLVAIIVVMPRAPDQSAHSHLATSQQESHRLERKWQDTRGDAPDNPIARANVRLVDRALQAAYDRGAAPAELELLWRKRNEALRRLVSRRPGSVAVTRI